MTAVVLTPLSQATKGIIRPRVIHVDPTDWGEVQAALVQSELIVEFFKQLWQINPVLGGALATGLGQAANDRSYETLVRSWRALDAQGLISEDLREEIKTIFSESNAPHWVISLFDEPSSAEEFDDV